MNKMHMQNPNIVLTGYMGTGKTTIGQLVAEKTGREFIDMDDIIISRIGKSIPEIFAAYGEAFFRGVEAGICVELGEARNLVIATGGGALIRADNLNAISGACNIVICLTADVDTIIARLDADAPGRPMIDRENEDRHTRISNLLKERRSAYQRIRLQLDTAPLSPEAAADEVLRIVETENQRNAIRTPVISPTNRYDILCAKGLLDDLPQILANYHLEGRIIVATNTAIAPLYGEKLVKFLPNAALVTMPDGEQYKTLESVQRLYSDFAQAGLDRGGIVIALGGGVVGDTVGFAAAGYMRGVRLIQIPTSLLAMVDSSVGAKVGVDIHEGKNLVGAFKQPELVIIDPNVLQTLPEIELRCGLIEAVKHGMLADPDLMHMTDKIRAGDADTLRRTIQVKVDVVQRDPYERGERAYLNLGHTFGHAIERVSGYGAWRHGEAISVGLIAAARLSHRISGLSAAEVERIENCVRSIGLDTGLRGLDPNAIWDAMSTDKKWQDGHSYFVILESTGKPNAVRDVPRETVIEILRNLN